MGLASKTESKESGCMDRQAGALRLFFLVIETGTSGGVGTKVVHQLESFFIILPNSFSFGEAQAAAPVVTTQANR